DGGETTLVNSTDGSSYRVYVRSGHELTQLGVAHDVRAEISRAVTMDAASEKIWLFGQDVSFAERLARKYAATAGVLQAIRESVDEHV
ncbi:hypothetical protein ABTA76_19855, partial [Acinetobacter baumannii]